MPVDRRSRSTVYFGAKSASVHADAVSRGGFRDRRARSYSIDAAMPSAASLYFGDDAEDFVHFAGQVDAVRDSRLRRTGGVGENVCFRFFAAETLGGSG